MIPIDEIAMGYFNLARQKLGILPETMLDLGTARYAICHTCDAFNPDDDRCFHCGCTMKAKTLSPKSFCPLGKWTMQPYIVEIRKMKILQPGHRYILQNQHTVSQGQVIQFIETQPLENESGAAVVADGTSMREVILMLINKIEFEAKPGYKQAIAHLNNVLALIPN